LKRSRKYKRERAEIEAAFADALEFGEEVANYREQTDHNAGIGGKPSLGALKHAQNKMWLERAERRLQFSYEKHGVASDRFSGMLHEYLMGLNATWYQQSHSALSEHREDLVTDCWLRMTDPANRSSKASTYNFRGVSDDGTPVRVSHFVNSVFSTFMKERDRMQRDYDFKHFRLVDDEDATRPVGDVRVG